MSKRSGQGHAATPPSPARPKGEQALDAETYRQIREAVRDLQPSR